MKTIKLVITSDVHGNIFPTNYTSVDNIEPYGLARISTAVKEFRKQGEVILLDNGDSFQGTPLLTYAQKFTKQRVNPIAASFNHLNYDFINLGNHDFNYGEETLIDFINSNNAKLLTSNVKYNNEQLGHTQIIELGDKSIALIGVVTHYIPNWERPAHIEHFTFEDAYTHLNEAVQTIKDDVDLVIAMYHGGLEKDPETGVPTERLTGENQGYAMCDIEGLDLLITGHQHRSLIETINGTLITQNAFKGDEFVSIDIDLETMNMSAQLIKSAPYPADEDLLSLFSELNDKTQVWLDQDVGHLRDGAILIEDEFDARLHKHPLVSLVNQVQIDRSKAQLASAALFNGVTGFNQNITMRDLVNTYLYPNTAVVKEMSGAALREMLEFSARYFALDDEGNITSSPEFEHPKPQHYNYDMVDGVDYTIKVSNPRGERIVSLQYNGKDVQDTDTFTLCVNNYRAMGGGNYSMVAAAPTVQEIQEDMQDTIMQYLLDNPSVVVNHKDNIKVIK